MPEARECEILTPTDLYKMISEQNKKESKMRTTMPTFPHTSYHRDVKQTEENLNEFLSVYSEGMKNFPKPDTTTLTWLNERIDDACSSCFGAPVFSSDRIDDATSAQIIFDEFCRHIVLTLAQFNLLHFDFNPSSSSRDYSFSNSLYCGGNFDEGDDVVCCNVCGSDHESKPYYFCFFKRIAIVEYVISRIKKHPAYAGPEKNWCDHFLFSDDGIFCGVNVFSSVFESIGDAMFLRRDIVSDVREKYNLHEFYKSHFYAYFLKSIFFYARSSLEGKDWVGEALQHAGIVNVNAKNDIYSDQKPTSYFSKFLPPEPEQIQPQPNENEDDEKLEVNMYAYAKKIYATTQNSEQKKWLNTFINCKLPAEARDLVQEAMTMIKASHIFEAWGINENFEKGLTNAILLYGPPGTGKSMLSESISALLGKKLLKIGTAELQSQIPGQTERNIQNAFKQAKQNSAVLMFDECDSVLYNREFVGSIMAAEINTLLGELENHDGVVVFTTNRIHKLDPAVDRRIICKIPLDPPDAATREEIWKALTPKKMPIASDVNFADLAVAELTGGEIKNALLLGARRAVAKRASHVAQEHFAYGISNILKSKTKFDKARNSHFNRAEANHFSRLESGWTAEGQGKTISNTGKQRTVDIDVQRTVNAAMGV